MTAHGAGHRARAVADPAPPGELRSDARRNRARLLAGARELLVVRGPDVPMDEFARAAAVGVGTLYRRFRSRDELVAEVVAEVIAELLGLADSLRRQAPDGWTALTRLVRGWLELRLNLPYRLLWAPADPDPLLASCRREWLDTLARFVAEAQSEGALRPELDPEEIVLYLILLSRQGVELGSERAWRMAELALDGLRART